MKISKGILGGTAVSTIKRTVRTNVDEGYNIIYLFTAIGLLPGGSGYFTC